MILEDLNKFLFSEEEEPEEKVEETPKEEEEEVSEKKSQEEIEKEVEEKVEEKPEDSSEKKEEKPVEKDKAPEEESEEGQYSQLMEYMVSGKYLQAVDEEYEDSEEGFKKLIADNIKKQAEEEVEKRYSHIDPSTAELIKYLENGGTLEDYNKISTQDYDTYDLSSEEKQKAILKEFLKIQDFDEEEIEDKIQAYEDADLLEKEANAAKKQLKKKFEKEREQQLKLQEEQSKIRREQQEKLAKEFSDYVLEADEIGGLAIPKKERKELLKYITDTDENGMTEFRKQFNDTDTLIKAAFLIKNNFNMDSVEKKVKTKNAVNLKQALSRVTDSGAKTGNRTQSKTSGSKVKKLEIPFLTSNS